MGTDKKDCSTIACSAPVKVSHADFGERIFNMRDMSNSGVFLLTGNELPLPVGTVVSIQVQGMLMEAPVLEAEIINKDNDGISLRFCND